MTAPTKPDLYLEELKLGLDRWHVGDEPPDPIKQRIQLYALIDRLEAAELSVDTWTAVRETEAAEDRAAAIEECEAVALAVLDRFCTDYLDEDGWTDMDELRHRLTTALRELKEAPDVPE